MKRPLSQLGLSDAESSVSTATPRRFHGMVGSLYLPSSDQLNVKDLEAGGDEAGKLSGTLVRSSKWLSWDRVLIACFIAIAGLSLGLLIYFFGVERTESARLNSFQITVLDAPSRLEDEFNKYVGLNRVMHTFMTGNQSWPSRERFDQLAASILSNKKNDFQVISFVPNVEHPERATLESQARTYWESRNVSYAGFRGLEPNKTGTNVYVQPRSNQSMYFPVHYLYPLEGNENAVDFDLYSSASRRGTIESAMETCSEALTPRLRLVQETVEEAWAVILFTPPLEEDGCDLTSSDMMSMVLRIPDLLRMVTSTLAPKTEVYLFDTTLEMEPAFLGGAAKESPELVRMLPSLPFEQAMTTTPGGLLTWSSLIAADRSWIIVIRATHEFEPQSTVIEALLCALFVLLGLGLAAVFLHRVRANHNQIVYRAMLETSYEKRKAEQRAAMESALNEFIAHEVRNPLSVSITASNLLKSALMNNRCDMLNMLGVDDDIELIESSLLEIDTLILNIADYSKCASGDIVIKKQQTRVAGDVFKHFQTHVLASSSNEKIEFDCPVGLIVEADPRRLVQILTNLTSVLRKMSTSCDVKRIVRVSANVVAPPLQNEDSFAIQVLDAADADAAAAAAAATVSVKEQPKVHGQPEGNQEGREALLEIRIEDAGVDIPEGIWAQLIHDFLPRQDPTKSGVELGVSRMLAQSMGGTLQVQTLSKSGDADNDGQASQGTRFVLTLPTCVLGPRSPVTRIRTPKTENKKGFDLEEDQVLLLEKASVLHVDDETIVRKIVQRVFAKVAPGWEVDCCASGEEALRMAKEKHYDIIIMDQYMPAAGAALQGDDTIRLLRIQGFTGVIVGFSANDMENTHTTCGADYFLRKPFPSRTSESIKFLNRVSPPPAHMKFAVVCDNLNMMKRSERAISTICCGSEDKTLFVTSNELDSAFAAEKFNKVDVVIVYVPIAGGNSVVASLENLPTKLAAIEQFQGITLKIGSNYQTNNRDIGHSHSPSGAFDVVWTGGFPQPADFKREVMTALKRNQQRV